MDEWPQRCVSSFIIYLPLNAPSWAAKHIITTGKKDNTIKAITRRLHKGEGRVHGSLRMFVKTKKTKQEKTTHATPKGFWPACPVNA